MWRLRPRSLIEGGGPTGFEMIRINDREEIEWQEGLTVSDLLERLNFNYPYIIVTIDGEVVPPEEYDSRTIADGSQVRLTHLIAGG